MTYLKWKASEIPGRQTRSGKNMWTQKVSPELIRTMRHNPGQAYQLLDQHENPARLTQLEVSAMLRGAPKPFRVQTRMAITGKPDGPRHVWVSMDPKYWSDRETKPGPKKATK